MDYLNLDIIKKHLNLENDFTEDDKYLELLGEAVEQAVSLAIDDSLQHVTDSWGGKLPTPLLVAMLSLCGTFYSNRENVAFASSTPVPYTYQYIIDLYRNYGDMQNGEKAQLYTLVEKCLDDLQKVNANTNIEAGNGIELDKQADKIIISANANTNIEAGNGIKLDKQADKIIISVNEDETLVCGTYD